ncbi:MAG: ankyrin repeat domain-containing protein [Verrucomicrobiota bacterium]
MAWSGDLLLEAVHHGQLSKVEELLKHGADVNTANRYGILPLHEACRNGYPNLVDTLLSAGAKVEAEEPGGVTALMVAARTGRVLPLRSLLEAGAGVNGSDRRGQTALMWAASEGNHEAVKLLLDAGAKREPKLSSGFNAWFLAARQGHLEVIKVLQKNGVEVDAVLDGQNGGGRAPRNGMSALMLATENGHFELATHLLESGANPNDLRSGFAPLHVMSWVRKPRKGDNLTGTPPPRTMGNVTGLQFVQNLIDHGADVNLQLAEDTKGPSRLGYGKATPFLLASRTADLPFMKLLIANGADFRLPNEAGRTPLLAAAGVNLGAEGDEAATEDEAIAAILYLLELGADINAVDKRGETAMHSAAYKQAPKIVRLLDERGADISVWNTKNKSGWTPLLISQGFRNGNFKPSQPVIDALSEVMRSHGIEPPPAPPRPVPGTKKEAYQAD